MQTTTPTVMTQVHEMLRGELGQLAGDLAGDGAVQHVFLPGGTYAVSVRQSTSLTVTITKGIGEPDWDLPGLGLFCLREHSNWLFGRLERNGDMLAVEHTLLIDGMTAQALTRCVVAVHESAIHTEQLLLAAGALGSPQAD